MTDLEINKALAQQLESTYHPCTSILIEGLKKLKAWDVLAEWDRAREIVDERVQATRIQQQAEPCQFCGLIKCDPRCMWVEKDSGVEQAEPVAQCSFPKCQTTGGCVGACTRSTQPTPPQRQ